MDNLIIKSRVYMTDNQVKINRKSDETVELIYANVAEIVDCDINDSAKCRELAFKTFRQNRVSRVLKQEICIVEIPKSVSVSFTRIYDDYVMVGGKTCKCSIDDTERLLKIANKLIPTGRR